jgi:hypothetical protein
MIAQQANEIKMANHGRLQGLKHVVLLVEVILKQRLILSASVGACLLISSPVKVDGDCVSVVDGAHEEVESVLVEDLAHNC